MRGLFGVLLVLPVLLLASATSALAAENENTVTFDIHCAIGGETVTFTGTLFGGAGGALHLEEGGLAISMGLKDVSGEIIVEPTPGLAKQGKLVECSFMFPGQPELVAFAFLVPPGAP
jgi:hypothetical protein